MTASLIFFLLVVPIALFWASGRAAAESANLHGRRACERAGVQWLDQSVYQTRLRLRRSERGRLVWERQFRFEYSTGGQDRHAGLITLLGDSLSGLVGPMPVDEAL